MTFKRRVLSALGKEELLAVGRAHELEVTSRMTVAELRDMVAKSKRVGVASIVSEDLSRDALKQICAAVGVDPTGAEKAALVKRILAAATGPAQETAAPLDDGHATARPASSRGKRASATPQAPSPGAPTPESARAWPPLPITRGSAAKESAEPLLRWGEQHRDAPAAAKPKVKAGRRRMSSMALDAKASGSLKAALQQFALAAAGGYVGRDGHITFATHLLSCFGWPDGRPPNAELAKSFSLVDDGRRVTREVALWWPERSAMLEIAPHEEALEAAWKDVLRVCLQLTPLPQYVVHTNQRDIHLYDLARDRAAPRLAVRLDDLPKYSEAFPFFSTDWVPGTTPRIVNVEKVSEEVADLVARLYRSVRAKHPSREREVIRFTLQCITAMFAEDIGLLPKSSFTTLLYEGAQQGNVEERLHELFVQMNTKDLPEPRRVPYFNGGLFLETSTLPLGPEQVMALTKAAEANWTYVDPHIFGSVFQGIMDDAERHASGAHYTAHADIMRVVGPTIVEPWRKRITAASSLKELIDLRKELMAFRVLDPACGSGNFLYVAFRELYRLDTELLSRMREFPSTHGKLSWNGGISAAKFYGIDINPFAVELAKVTLNIAKKIAFEERKAQAFALGGQVEMDIDPSLPLDNLDDNIVCADALFTEWPKVDAIVGNPPFLGGQKIRKELGTDYLRRLQEDTGLDGVVDMACYWFRKAHDHLKTGGRAGLVATSGIRVGKAKAASLDYLVKHSATITNAVSSRLWPGAAAINVSMVNWVKGEAPAPFSLFIDEQHFLLPKIPSHLQMFADVGAAAPLSANAHGSSMGPIFGHSAFRSGSGTFTPDEFGATPCIKPVATANSLLRGKFEGVCIWLAQCESENEVQAVSRSVFDYLKDKIFQIIKERADNEKETAHYRHWLRTWWKAQMPRADLFRSLVGKGRFIVSARNAGRPIFMFLSAQFVPTDTLYIFAFDDDYTFGLMQSGCHWKWTVARGVRVREDITYTSDVWRTFPWPQDPTEDQVAAVAAAGRGVRRVRAELMEQNGWSLRQLYQAAEVEGPHPLKEAQAALDAAVRDAYGMSSDQDPLTFLLELNQLVAEDESLGRKVRGPGLPDHLDPRDPRFFSTDCIEPPPLAG